MHIKCAEVKAWRLRIWRLRIWRLRIWRLRIFASTVFIGSFTGVGIWAAEAETYMLRSQHRKNHVADVQIEYRARGTLNFPAEQEVERLAMEVSAELAFQERQLSDLPPAEGRIESAPNRFSGATWSKGRAARYYDQVDVAMTINDQKLNPELRDDRRLIGIYLGDNSLEFHSPAGPLSREELDLIRLPGDRQTLPLILPKKPVQVGATWKQDATALAMLLGLDAVGDSDVTSELKSVERGYAKVELAGIVHGATAGVATEIALKARYYFDLRRGEFAALQLVTRERREIGHVNPGVEVTARLKMSAEPKTDAGELSDQKVAPLQGPMDGNSQQLGYRSAALGVAFQYDRNWFVTAEDHQVTVLRRLDRGQLVAQCNVTSLPNVKKGKAVTLSQFQEDIRKNLDSNFGTFTSASESTNGQRYLVYRVEAAGTTSQIPVRWIYYLLSDTGGRRVAVVFTMEDDLVESFGSADKQIVESLEFVATQGAKKETSESVAEDGKQDRAE
jgi:hypothetical protein